MIGKQIEQYRIETLLGEGGMGSVYRAWDTNLSRQVAVKVMYPQFASQAEFRKRFMQEAKAPARLSHPSIVHIYDFGSTGGMLYLVMEYIPGKTLNQHIKQCYQEKRIIHLKETLVVLGQVADALDYAHKNGVIHRDVKPDNIMLRVLDRPDRENDPPLRAEVTDFGLVKLLEGGVETQTGTFLGTLPYMSPEQCFGLPIDGRSDIYSLGVILYQLTTGCLPLDIRTPTDAILKHQNEQPKPPSSLRPEIPKSVEEIIQKALAKKPEARYPTAGILYQELRRTADKLQQEELVRFSPPESVFSMATQLKVVAPQEEVPSALDHLLEKNKKPTGDYLHILVADQTMRSIPLKPGILKLGRGEDSDLVLDDPQASRLHVKIEYNGQELFVTDMNSTNGTFIEDFKLLPGVREPWQPGRAVRIGSTWIKYEISTPVTKAPPDRFRAPLEADIRESTSVGGRVTLAIKQLKYQMQPGVPLQFQAVVLNQGSIVDHFSLTIQNLPAGWNPAEPVDIQLMPSEQKEIQLLIPPAPSQVAAGTHEVHLAATSRAVPIEVAKAQITLVVPPHYQAAMTLRPQKQRSVSSGNYTLEISNSGNTSLDMQLSAEDPELACLYTFLPPTLHIPPAGMETAKLTVQPRQTQRTMRVSFWVTARSGTSSEIELKTAGEWEQLLPTISMEIVPPTQTSPTGATYEIQLTNTCESDLLIELAASSVNQSVKISLQPTPILLPAGNTSKAWLQAIPIKLSESTLHHTLKVTATLAGTTTEIRQASAEWIQNPPPAPPPAPAPTPQVVAPAPTKATPPEQIVAPSPGIPMNLPEPVKVQKASGARKVGSCLVLILCLAITVGAGFLGGNLTFELIPGSGEIEAWIVATIVWVIGLVISVRIFRKVSKPG